MGKEYGAMQSNPAMLHLLTYLMREHERLTMALINSEEQGGPNRVALQVLDRALKIPDMMVRSGKESERTLKQLESRNG